MNARELWGRSAVRAAQPAALRLTSVGIDVGTTTTQLVFSALEIVNTAGPTSVPHYVFSKRELLHLSPVVFTPWQDAQQVDVAALEHFIRGQYAQAGLALADVDTGAVIITGETSKARNARQAVLGLAQTLGDFVVATAGPHLESVLAGRGSGAAQFAREQAACVLNIDVGGGTSNFAVFEGERLSASACLNVGGRLLQTDAQGQVHTVHPPAAAIAQALWGQVPPVGQWRRAQVDAVVQTMADLVLQVLQGQPSALAQQLLMTAPLPTPRAWDAVFVSGGVGACMPGAVHAAQNAPAAQATPAALDAQGVPGTAAQDPFRYGDVGPLLAQALHQALAQAGIAVRTPPQTLRATVIGAGAHTLTLSGSTVWNRYQGPALRNVPVLHPALAWRQYRPGALLQAWEQAAQQHDLDPAQDLYALALASDMPLSCQTVWQTALELQQFARRHSATPHPLVVVTHQDLGKALGLELFRLLPQRALLVIDEVHTQDGDYLDIGHALLGAGAIPVTVKSLAFPT